jgi:hypothetical protein
MRRPAARVDGNRDVATLSGSAVIGAACALAEGQPDVTDADGEHNDAKQTTHSEFRKPAL